jgi:hypothetical protein
VIPMQDDRKPRLAAMDVEGVTVWRCERLIAGNTFVGMAGSVLKAWEAAHPVTLPPCPFKYPTRAH